MCDFPMLIRKSALLLLNPDSTQFLVTRKNDSTVTDWLLPGGTIEEGETLIDALVREIWEELQCEVDKTGIELIGEYEAPAAGRPGQIVHITLFRATIAGTPRASSEIKELGWLSKEDVTNPEASETIRLHLIPDLVKRGILL